MRHWFINLKPQNQSTLRTEKGQQTRDISPFEQKSNDLKFFPQIKPYGVTEKPHTYLFHTPSALEMSQGQIHIVDTLITLKSLSI